MTDPRFTAVFEIGVTRDDAWSRLTAAPSADPDSVWLPGFASNARLVARDVGRRLEAVKSDPPCAHTTIVIAFEDAATGTVVTVTQSGFDGGLPAPRELMDIGWQLIVADLHAYLATGVDPGRHLQQWRDFGADAARGPGGVWIGPPRPGTMADRLQLREGDLLVGLGGAAITDLADLVSLVRATHDQATPPTATCIRDAGLVELSPRT